MLPVAVRRLLRTAAASSPVLAAPRLLCTAPTDADATPSSSSSSPPDQEVQEPTSFGFRTVAAADKAGLVAGVFSAVAPRYDVMNDLMSLGLHRGWKDRLVRELRPAPGALHLDVAGGTGDVAFRVLAALRVAERAQRLSPAAQGWGAADGGVPPACARPPPPGAVLVADINPDMLAEGRRRADAAGLRSADEALGEGGVPALAGCDLGWLVADAECLPLADGCVDAYTIAFGLRNVTRPAAALAEAVRVLRPGGRLLVLEFSTVRSAPLRAAYDALSFALIPPLGKAVTGDGAPYAYLVESIRCWASQGELADMLRAEGLAGVTHADVLGGVAAIHSGFKL